MLKRILSFSGPTGQCTPNFSCFITGTLSETHLSSAELNKQIICEWSRNVSRWKCFHQISKELWVVISKNGTEHFYSKHK